MTERIKSLVLVSGEKCDTCGCPLKNLPKPKHTLLNLQYPPPQYEPPNDLSCRGLINKKKKNNIGNILCCILHTFLCAYYSNERIITRRFIFYLCL